MSDTNTTTKPYVPVWEKYALTIYEAAEYFGIGEHRLRTLIRENRLTVVEAAKYFQIGESNIRRLTREHKDEDFIQWKDSRVFIRREEFEKFLDRTNVI